MLTLKYLIECIDNALKEGEKRRGAMPQTNVLNAEFSLGKYFAILDIIKTGFGIEAMIDVHEKYNPIIDDLMKRTQDIY